MLANLEEGSPGIGRPPQQFGGFFKHIIFAQIPTGKKDFTPAILHSNWF
jgi:hypothetical protein